MAKPVSPTDLDKVIQEPARMAIMAALAATPAMTFTDLKETTGLTDGNLSVHARTLQNAGYISIRKEFVDLKPQTTMELTDAGRKAFRKHLDMLEEIIRQARK